MTARSAGEHSQRRVQLLKAEQPFDVGEVVENGNRGIDRRRSLSRVDRIPIMRAEATLEGRPHSRTRRPLHIPPQTVSYVKDFRIKNTRSPHCLGKNSMIGVAGTNVRRGDKVGDPHPSGLLQARLPSRP